MACVRDLLARKGGALVTVTGTTTVLDASTLMVERGIGGVVVLDDEGRLAGIFTERDVLRRVVAVRLDPAQTLVRDVMTAPVLTVLPETALEECQATMTERRIRHLPVLGPTGLAGLVSSGDVLAYTVAERQDTIQQLESYVYSVR
ncbi:CBS domain-containing protein [Roseisolibacter agri]|uniref:Inosine-5-monophosphate dehydrogenase n=1 Tax=Roseisolibacter agri TaxID=2014610 RepID=A0AA37Q8S6_9BACT|nr:CBS domain-containing protein [Roseisolibacter agri]GLC25817.1 inosine-5-monophosphate dehydrogenase [Roseisolibacter agri]